MSEANTHQIYISFGSSLVAVAANHMDFLFEISFDFDPQPIHIQPTSS